MPINQLQALLVEVRRVPSRPALLRADRRNRIAEGPRTSWTYYGNNVRLPEAIGPGVCPNSHTVTAEDAAGIHSHA
jgi:hypothetical protein